MSRRPVGSAGFAVCVGVRWFGGRSERARGISMRLCLGVWMSGGLRGPGERERGQGYLVSFWESHLMHSSNEEITIGV
jgi:hypothetical protein